ncbi:LRR receptor-like serine/threonine-protein kinase SIK1 isoform X1 [Oryza sativa Japonica Group]|uniref:LRR receptor-like serine/threonine-protein kinase SIK1 isoform X1 n=2 Tax=Oryza sativa subsp. japonica TaxID=39947 RepID=UPI00339C5366
MDVIILSFAKYFSTATFLRTRNYWRLLTRNLADNNFQGPIPANISSCTALNKFNVYGNELNGSIPAGFQKLESLDLLEHIFKQFQGINSMDQFLLLLVIWSTFLNFPAE